MALYHTTLVRFVTILTNKCLKILLRQKSTRQLSIVSTILVFGGLYAVYLSCFGQSLHYLTNDGYSPLSFDYKCKPVLENVRRDPSIGDKHGFESTVTSSLECDPFDNSKSSDGRHADITPSTILANIVSSGSMFGSNNRDDDKQTAAFANMLMSLLMNGLPLMGLRDYVKLSDFINQNIGESRKDSILGFSAYREKFGNFLDVRMKDILIVSKPTCIGFNFIDYLKTQLGKEHVS
jgi:hypothetical protein